MAVGSAYGVFRANHSSLHLGKTLAGIRQGMLNGMKLEPEPNIPKELALDVCALWYISTGAKAAISGFQADKQLVAIAREWKDKGANYFIRAVHPGATNEKAAMELGFVVRIMYAGLIIETTGADDRPIADVYYIKQDGSYVSARLEPPGTGQP
jgi:hypothetical protein